MEKGDTLTQNREEDKPVELRVLRYFLAVARMQSISAAAEELHITQPTLSRQLMELEEELGAKLFDRGRKNRRVALTEAGKRLHRQAEEIVALADKTLRSFQAPQKEISGEIAIGGGETDAMRLVARAARALTREHPNIRYHLYSGNAEDVTERLDKGLLDFGILIEPVSLERYDYIQLPAADTWGLLMRRDHPLARKQVICPGDLLGVPLLVSRQRMVDNTFSGWLGQSVRCLRQVGTYNLIYGGRGRWLCPGPGQAGEHRRDRALFPATDAEAGEPSQSGLEKGPGLFPGGRGLFEKISGNAPKGIG